jgi:hypothetical protein
MGGTSALSKDGTGESEDAGEAEGEIREGGIGNADEDSLLFGGRFKND